VTQIHRGAEFLRGFDDDVRHFLHSEMAKAGVEIRLNAEAIGVVRTDTGLRVTLRGGETVDVDQVLYATGRAPNTEGLGLERLGVDVDARGAVVVGDGFQSSVPSIYALGDVIDRVQLTPVALAEAMALVDQLFGSGVRQMAYELVPTAVFTHPTIGSVGLTESEARARFANVRIYRSEFKALKHTLSGSSERTLMKLVVDDASDRVVGLHMVGPEAGEIVQGFAVALKAGATKAIFDATVGIHPTAAEEFVTMREAVPAAARR
jgi:glutathione reductase (NADPH)